MNRYHVKYFYSATGMEGRADTKDYGIVYARNKEEAKNKILETHYPNEKKHREWLKSCLQAKKLD